MYIFLVHFSNLCHAASVSKLGGPANAAGTESSTTLASCVTADLAGAIDGQIYWLVHGTVQNLGKGFAHNR